MIRLFKVLGISLGFVLVALNSSQASIFDIFDPLIKDVVDLLFPPKPASVVTPSSLPINVAAQNRNVLALIYLDNGTGNSAAYGFLEGLDAVTMSLLSTQYNNSGSGNALVGSNATLQNFSDNLQLLAKDPNIKAVDTFISLHGSSDQNGPSRLGFYDYSWTTKAMSLVLNRLDSVTKSKERLLYSLACYGASHNQDWINAGYQTAVGSIGLNLSEFFSAFLQDWSTGKNVSEAIWDENNSILSGGQQLLKNVSVTIGNIFSSSSNQQDLSNCTKVVAGNSTVRINYVSPLPVGVSLKPRILVVKPPSSVSVSPVTPAVTPASTVSYPVSAIGEGGS